jgi:hypothetical protein
MKKNHDTPLTNQQSFYPEDGITLGEELVPAELARWLERSMNEYRDELIKLKSRFGTVEAPAAGDQPKQQVDPV